MSMEIKLLHGDLISILLPSRNQLLSHPASLALQLIFLSLISALVSELVFVC